MAINTKTKKSENISVLDYDDFMIMQSNSNKSKVRVWQFDEKIETEVEQYYERKRETKSNNENFIQRILQALNK